MPALALVLNCVYCDKVFTSEKSRKRHHYYCRSKQHEPTPSRKRACVACSQAKARCDMRYPTCRRCSQRGVDCSYRSSPAPPTSRARETPTRPWSNLDVLDVSMIMNEAPVEIVDLDIDDMLEIRTLGNITPPSSGSSTPPSPGATTSRSSLSTIPPILRTQTFGVRPRDPSKRPIQQMVKSIASSYVHMFRHNHTLPPFMHRSQPLDTPPPNHAPSLATCRKLLNQYFATPPLARSAIWSQITAESERIWFSHDTFSQWELLASLQSLLFYSILRITQPPNTLGGPSPDADLPFLICINHVVLALASRISCRCDREILESESLPHSEWLFFEARRRTIVVYRLLSLLVDISDAIPCIALPRFAVVPLPMPDVLWEADGAEAWRRGLERVRCEETLFGMMEDGSLKKMRVVGDLQEPGTGIELYDGETWEEWYAGTGGLGILVATVAQLL